VPGVDRTAYFTPAPRRGRWIILASAVLLVGTGGAALTYRPRPGLPAIVDGVIDPGRAIVLPITDVAVGREARGSSYVAFFDARRRQHLIWIHRDGSFQYDDAGPPLGAVQGPAVAWFALQQMPSHAGSERLSAIEQGFPRNYARLMRWLGR
jgi:hypothetical protein